MKGKLKRHRWNESQLKWPQKGQIMEVWIFNWSCQTTLLFWIFRRIFDHFLEIKDWIQKFWLPRSKWLKSNIYLGSVIFLCYFRVFRRISHQSCRTQPESWTKSWPQKGQVMEVWSCPTSLPFWVFRRIFDYFLDIKDGIPKFRLSVDSTRILNFNQDHIT